MNRTAKVLIVFLSVLGSVFAQHQERISPEAQRAGRVLGRLVVQVHRDAGKDAVAQSIAGHGAALRKNIPQLRTHVIEVPEALMDRVAASLERSGLFTVVERDAVAQGAATPNDPSFLGQWHLGKIKAPAAWDLTKGSTGIKIAVLDSGVDATHPDLKSKIVPGWNFVKGTSDTRDISGHGTAVAGAVAAATNNLTGVAGVAWSNMIMPVVVLDSNNYASYSNIASGITYAVDHGARIINISLGGSTQSSTLQNAVDYATSRGAVVFGAATNNSNQTRYYPAACNNAVAVSATTQSDSLAGFSNYGSWITLSAPGDYILTTTAGGGYGSWYGTSLATPVAAGVGALVLSRNPSLTAAQVISILKKNSDDLGSSGFDSYYGWGRVNAYRAVAAAGGSPPPAPAPSPAAPTPAPSPAPSGSPGASTIRVNAGGGAYVDPQGRTWRADYGYDGGNTYTTPKAILNTSTPVLYRSERWKSSTLQYLFSVTNGRYSVRLKFAEIAFTQRGQRIFNVVINGQRVLSNFDIVAQAGPNVAIDKQFAVNVTGGKVTIQLLGVVQNPKISAIEIVPSASVPSAPSTPSPSATIRVRAGVGTVTDSQGHVWNSDYGYLAGYAYRITAPISNTPDPALYQGERWNYGNLQYQFAVPNGTRTVTLKFAEIAFTSVGQRVFNILINGKTVLTNLDIVAQAGGARVALDKHFTVNVTNGKILIQLVGVVQNPKISAIQIQ